MKGIIKSRYPSLKGKDWIRTISKEDKDALIALLHSNADHGKIGGYIRASNANRDNKGRFTPGRASTMEKITARLWLTFTQMILEHGVLVDTEEQSLLEMDVLSNPDNPITHPTEESEHEFFTRYTKPIEETNEVPSIDTQWLDDLFSSELGLQS